MVTAGVYMVARSNAVFVLAPTAMKTVPSWARSRRCSLRRLASCRRHQARAGLLHRFATGYMFWRSAWEHLRPAFPCVHACVLQSAALPRFGLGDSRHEREQDMRTWRPATSHPDYIQDDVHRDAGDCGYLSVRRFLLKRRNPVADVSSEGGAYRILWFIGYGTR